MRSGWTDRRTGGSATWRRTIGAALAAVTVAATALTVPIMTLVATATTAGATTLGCLGSQLPSGGELHGGQCLASTNGKFELVMQTTGNLELYNTRYHNGLWSTGTPGHPGGWAVNGNGNFIVYPVSGGALWASNTGTTGATVVLQTTGNLVVTSSGRQLWQTGTQASTTPCAGGTISQGNGMGTGAVIGAGGCLLSTNGKFELQMENTGNLALHSVFLPTDGVVWSTNTSGYPNAYAVDQGGNFIVYPQGGPALWASNTGYSYANYLLRTTGNFVIASPDGHWIWTTGTTYTGNLNCVGSTLTIGQTLAPGQCLTAGTATLWMQTDGNLVSYFKTPTSGTTAVWAAGTSGRGNQLVLPKTLSGVAQIQGSNGNPIRTLGYLVPGDQPDSLTLQPNGNVLLQVQVSSTKWKTTWQSGCKAVNFSTLLTSGSTITSPSGEYQLLMQTDGNLVLYFQPSGTALWSTVTQGHPGAYAVQQTDGNLVVYAANGKTALWQSGTTGTPSSTLSVQDDGNVVIYGTNPAGPYAVWSTGTAGDKGHSLAYGQDLQPGQYIESPTGQYRLVMAPGGVLALYETQPYACPMWTVPGIDRNGFEGSHTPGSYLTVGGPGLVDIYPPGTTRKSPLWTPLTKYTSGYYTGGLGDHLTLQSDGNLVFYNSVGAALWSSGTNTLRGSILCTGSTLTQGQYVTDGPGPYWGEGGTMETGHLTLAGCNLYGYVPSSADKKPWKTSFTGVTGTPTTKHVTLEGTADETCKAIMQTTGNLVVYHYNSSKNKTVAVWASNTVQSNPPHFDATALGPYLTMVEPDGAKPTILYVATSHAKILGDPKSHTATGSKILGFVLTAIGLVFDVVGGPLGAVSTALGTIITYGGIGDAALGAGNSFWAAGHTLTGQSGSAERVAPNVSSTAGSSSTTVTTCTSSSPSQLTLGVYLRAGGCLWMDGGTYRLVMQADGNLVLYAYGDNPAGSTPTVLWNSGTASPGNVSVTGQYATVTPAGAFTVVTPTAQWSSTTTGNDPVLQLKKNGDLVLWSGAPGAGGSVLLWQSGTSAVTVTGCSTASSPSVLLGGETMRPGSCLFSPNGQYELMMQTDGNLVEYLRNPWEALWASGTAGRHTTGPTTIAYLGADGNFDVSAPSKPPYWQSTSRAAYSLLSLQNDGNVIIYGNNGKVSIGATPYAVWQTGTGSLRGNQLTVGEALMPGQYLESKNGQYKLTVGFTGVLQLTITTATKPSYVCPMWVQPQSYVKVTGTGSSKSYSIGHYTKPVKGSYLVLQTDGNLVLSKPTGTTTPVFDSGKTLSNGTTVPYLVLGTDGNLVIYPSSGSTTALWTSGTNRERGTGLCTNERLTAGQYIFEPSTPTNAGKYENLAMQSTCNLVYYAWTIDNRKTVAMWASTTDVNQAGQGKNKLTKTRAANGTYDGCYVIMQPDGNFVMYAPKVSGAIWSTGTAQTTTPPQLVKNLGPYEVVITSANDTTGVTHLEVVSDTGKVLWYTTKEISTDVDAGESAIVQGLVQVLTYVVPILLGA